MDEGRGAACSPAKPTPSPGPSPGSVAPRLGRIDEWRADPAPQIDPAAVFNPSYWRTETETIAADLYEAVAAAGIARMSDAFGIALDIDTATVQAFIQARANQLAARSPTPPTRAIRDVLAEGVQTGQTIDGSPTGSATFRHRLRHPGRDDRPYRGDLRVQRASPAGRHQLGGDVVAGQGGSSPVTARTAWGTLTPTGRPSRSGSRSMSTAGPSSTPGDPRRP